VPDRRGETLISALSAQVAEQLHRPTGSRVAVVNLDVGHGDLINDPDAQQTIGAAADRLHSQAHGE
jgi:hypothetical protein